MNTAEYIRQCVAKAISSHSNIEQPRVIKTSGYTMTFLKTENFSNKLTINEGFTKVDLPSLNLTNQNISIIVSNFKNIFYRIVHDLYIFKTVSMPMASCVHNGDNETKIALSHSLSVSLSDNKGNEIKIKNSSKLIDIWIPRDFNYIKNVAQFVNITNLLNNETNRQLFPIGFNKSTVNSSIHVELSPVKISIGYLVLLKLNMTPRINSTFQDYDYWKMFCPSGILLVWFIR
jgi:hypothetical protein